MGISEHESRWEKEERQGAERQPYYQERRQWEQRYYEPIHHYVRYPEYEERWVRQNERYGNKIKNIGEKTAETATEQETQTMITEGEKTIGPKNDQPQEPPEMTENIKKTNIKGQWIENWIIMQWKYSKE